MSATCYLCDHLCAAIQGKTPGDALGSCQNCSILACDAHAQRDSSYPRWICALCDDELLTAAGISASGGPSLGSKLTTLVSSAMLSEGARYTSLEEFLVDRPAYAWLSDKVPEIRQAAPARFTTQDTEFFWFNLSEEGQRFIAAAIGLAERLEVSEDDVVEALRVLIHVWRLHE